jgi:hypothetical protein
MHHISEEKIFWSLGTNTTPNLFLFYCSRAPSGPGPPYFRGFSVTLRYTTLVRTPLDEQKARRRNFYLTTHNTLKRQTSTSPVGFQHNPYKHAAADQRLRPHDHWGRYARFTGRYEYLRHIRNTN